MKSEENSMQRYKKIGLIIVLFFNVIQGCSTQEHIDRYFREIGEGPVTYLLSYPRSGNSLLRYLIEFVTKRPTLAFQRTSDKINLPLGICLHELHTDMLAKPAWKVHTCRKITGQPYHSTENVQVVLVIRNYKENIFRESQVWKLNLFDGEENLNEAHLRAVFSWYCTQNRMCKYDPDYQQYGNTGTQLYFDNIAFFDQLPEENKLLIYYEDLIHETEKELYRICDFFETSYEYIPVLMKDYGKYKNRILAFYPENKTTGTEKIYYSKKYSVKQKKQVDEYVKQHYPDLWEKYLQRYQEID